MGSFATWIFEGFSSFLHIFGSRKFKSFLDFRMRLKSEFATVSFSLTCTCLILQNFLFVGSIPYDDICCMCGVACPSHTFCLKAFSASFLELRSFRTLKSLKMPLLPANRNQSYIPSSRFPIATCIIFSRWILQVPLLQRYSVQGCSFALEQSRAT